MRKASWGGIILLVFVTGMSQSAMAQPLTGGKINFGRLAVVPGLAVQEVYDDNIFLTNGGNDTDEREVSDWISHIYPNLLLNYTLDGRGSISAGYLGDYAYYKDNDSNDYKNHTALFNLNYTAPGGLLAGVENTYVDAADPFGSENQYKLGVQTERWNDTLRTNLGFRFSDRFKVLGYFNWYKQDYDRVEDFSQDYEENEFGVGFQMRILPLTWGFIRYFMGDRDYYSHPPGFGTTEANDADLDWQRVNVGLAWDPEGKLRGELNFGYAWKEYENTFSPTGGRYDAEDSLIAATKISYVATATTTLNFTVLRAIRESGGDSPEFFEDTGASIGLTQELYYRLTLLANFVYSRNDFNLPLEKPREHDNYLANLALEYKLLDWLAATTSYTYNRKDSNYPEDEYVVNQFMVGLRALY
jgi:hypothetical protein